MRGLVVAVAMLAGCHLTPQSQVQEVAEQFCRCAEPGIGGCEAMVEQELGAMVTQSCVDCVFDHEHTCASMIDECPQLCFSFNQPQPGGQ